MIGTFFCAKQLENFSHHSSSSIFWSSWNLLGCHAVFLELRGLLLCPTKSTFFGIPKKDQDDPWWPGGCNIGTEWWIEVDQKCPSSRPFDPENRLIRADGISLVKTIDDTRIFYNGLHSLTPAFHRRKFKRKEIKERPVVLRLKVSLTNRRWAFYKQLTFVPYEESFTNRQRWRRSTSFFPKNRRLFGLCYRSRITALTK